MPKSKKEYYESEAKRRWQKENTVFFGLKLQKTTDKKLIAFLQSLDNKQAIIKQALREYMERQEQKSKEENKTE